MRVIAVINQKGGVGKTTTTLNLAHALAQKGKQVLALDLDPQAHLTAGFGLLERHQAGLADVMLGELPLHDVLLMARDDLYLAPAGERLGELEHLTGGGAQRGWLLHDALGQELPEFDFILIDCPPSSGILGMNALMAAREVLIPVTGDFFALQGLSRLMHIFGHIESTLRRKFEKWVVLTRFQERRRLAREVRDKITSYLPDHILQTAIRETVALAESPGFGQTIFEYQKSGNGAEDYRNLADDVVDRRTLDWKVN